MARKRRPYVTDEPAESFWPSFTDLTSTIALILFVLVLLAYIQNLISGKNLEHLRSQLTATLQRLETSQKQVRAAEQRLSSLSQEIKLSEERVRAQEAVIDESGRELSELRSRLSGIALLRLSVLEKVKASIESQLPRRSPSDGPLVRISENGNIVINESLVFEYDSHTIKAEGKPLLDTLAKAFAHVLGDPSVRENIDFVLVQGHTDERGSSAYNRELSAKRANAVLDYMFETDKELENSYGPYFASAAYSEFRPISTEQTDEARRQNRRIEVSVVLKDASVRTLIDEYMQGVKEAAGADEQPEGGGP